MKTDKVCSCGGEIIEQFGCFICLDCGWERDEDEFEDCEEY